MILYFFIRIVFKKKNKWKDKENKQQPKKLKIKTDIIPYIFSFEQTSLDENIKS